MNEHVHPIFQGILNMMMPAQVRTVYDDPVERERILEERRDEYRSGLDDVDERFYRSREDEEDQE